MDNFDSTKVDRSKFMEALFSPLLKLNLTPEEKEVLSIMYDVNRDKKVERDEVGSLCRELLGIYCMKNCVQPKKTWCRIELPSGDYISCNKQYYRLSVEHPIEKDYGEGGHPSGLEIKFKETFEYALAEILTSLRLTRRQEPISKEFIYSALTKFHVLTSKTKASLDKAVFGGQTFPTFQMPEAVKKFKECIFYVHSLRYPHEVWSPLTTEQRGIFWLNNHTKEAYGSLPPIYVRLLQYQIKDRDEKLKVVPGLRKREEDANRLEVENAAQKEEIEKMKEHITFQDAKLDKAEKDVEALQRDLLSRSEELSGKTIDVMHYKKTQASLEKRIEEYEKIYTQYELNKELLKFSQRTVKEKEEEIKKKNEDIEKLNDTITDLENQIQFLMTDKEKLLNDIREEVRLSEEKEIRLEAIPEYEKKAREAEDRTQQAVEETMEKEQVISNLEQKITDQQKEIEDCQNELRILPEITQDTKYLSCQVWTLRRLLSGKDEIIRKQLNQVAAVTGNVEDVYGTQKPPASNQGSKSATTTERSRLNLNMHHNVLLTGRSGGGGGQSRAKTAMGSPGSRPSSRRAHKQASLQRIPEWRSPSGRETFDPVLDGVPGNGGEGGVGEGVGGRVGTKGNRYEERMDLNLEPVPDYHDTDLQLSKYITKGFRVSLREMKREKYGKVPLTGTVKWMGTLDRRKSHHRLYLGLKLDSQVGNTDGLVHGHRLFKCPPGFGKMILSEEIESVFDRKEGKYIPVVMFIRLREVREWSSANNNVNNRDSNNAALVNNSGGYISGADVIDGTDNEN
ncbi:uncharacterized protein LOC142354498 isoform X2 [Convolutriloba macropyga]|uniref:uncharacterized protein LOC142354498 isoform X2 n=1 Tax=Convolutriloba macropyga TaxID=536237 RepID=UPI003F525618